MRKKNPVFSVLSYLAIFLVAFTLGTYSNPAPSEVAMSKVGGGFLGELFDIKTEEVAPAESDRDWLDEFDSELFLQVKEILDEKYPFGEPDEEELEYSLVEGLVESYGDKYTVFLRPVSADDLRTEIRGSFYGIGVEVAMINGRLTVVAPLPGSPAQKAGLLPRDVIIAVDEKDVTDMNIDDIVDLIRGPRNTKVKLSVLRKGEVSEVEVVRDKIDIPTMRTYVKDDIFLVQLYTFSENSDKLMKKAIKEFEKSGAKAFVVDLRGNPGGLLDRVIAIASYFLPKGAVIVKESSDPEDKDLISYTNESEPLLDIDVPVYVLIDAGSASASEIFAGAIKDNERGKILGVKSFGKGSVQEFIRLDGTGASLKVTVAKWLTPNNTHIDDVGIKPNVDFREEAEKFIESGGLDDNELDIFGASEIRDDIDGMLENDFLLRKTFEYVSEDMANTAS